MFKQGLFWKNLPETKKRKSNNIDFLKKVNAVSYIKDPCFIFTGTGNIKFPELSLKDIKKLNGVIKVFLYEPQSFYISELLNRGYYSEFRSEDRIEKIRSLELDSIELFSKNNGLEIIVYTCEYNLDNLKKQYPTLNLKCFDLFIRSQRPTGKYKNKEIQKKFWCGNWRYTLHRHLIMSWLSSKSGNYSWNFKFNNTKVFETNVFNFSLLKKIDPKYQTRLLNGMELLNQTRYSIDHDFKSPVLIEDEKNLYFPSSNNNKNDLFYKSFSECFCLISNETRFFQPYANISEKTLYSIDQKMPLVLVAPPYSLAYLQKLGFKTFNLWWDESYDIEENHEKRLLKILDVIDYIDSMNIEQLEKIYIDMMQILNHNYSILQNLYKDQTIID
jgi:hypothetical protein